MTPRSSSSGGGLEIGPKVLPATFAFTCALLLSTAASAARPLDTEDTGTAERVELEVSLDHETASAGRAWTLTGVVNVGVLQNLELNVLTAV